MYTYSFFFFRSTNPPIKDRLTNLKIIDEMLRVYDRRATPTNKIGTPTRVVCELFIRSFGSISEKTMVSLPNSMHCDFWQSKFLITKNTQTDSKDFCF